MSGRDLTRLVVGIVLGLGLASLPFLQYSARWHQHAALPAHDHAHHD